MNSSPPDPSITHGSVCPNCHALNATGDVRCRSCGVDIRAYSELYPELQQQDTLGQAEQELQAQQQRIRYAFRLLFIGAIAVLILIPSVVFISDYLDGVRRVQIEAQFAVAKDCLADQDYVCARDRLADLLAKEPDYIAARPLLRDTRYSLAVQLAGQQQWVPAVEELEALLQDFPADPEALVLLKQVYGHWYNAELAQGDWLQALVIYQRQQARFVSIQAEQE